MSTADPLHYHLRLLGPIQVERNGDPIGRLESRKALGVLCYLSSQTKPVSRSLLAALFWSDKSETRGRGNLSRVLHNISQELPDSLEADRHNVQFRHNAGIWVDAVQFDVLANSKKLHLMAAATEFYRGEFLEDLSVPDCSEFEMWMAAEREQWRQRMAQLFQIVIGHHLERGEYEQGLRYASRLLTLDPWREEVHRQKMMLLHLNGQRTAALAQYERCQQVLAHELGVEPSQETEMLRQQIEELQDSLTSSFQSMQPREPLMERGEEHTWLVRRWEDARRGIGKFTLVGGEAGVGKTVLVEEVLSYAASHGARVLRSRCYENQSGLTYEAFINALRPLFDSHNNILGKIDLAQPWLHELVHLWPEVQSQLSSAPFFANEEGTVRHRLFEAIAQLLSETIAHEREIVLFLDDLHEADQPMLDLLRYLYHRLHTKSIWFVCAYRREETTPNHPLSLFRNVLIREGNVAATELAPLNNDSIFQILRHYNGLASNQVHQLGHFLQKQCEGNPFVLEQVRNALQDASILVEEQGVWRMDEQRFGKIQENGLAVPTAVAAMIENRLARLNPRARRLLQTAAVIGRIFHLSLLVDASGEPEEWVEICLASWMARGLVEEVPGEEIQSRRQHCYRFGHIMLWRVVLEELAPLQRMRLEERIDDTRQNGSATIQTRTVRRQALSHVEELGD